MIKDVLIVGSGSAGLLFGLSLKLKIPGLKVRMVRSPQIGVITVGEATTPNLPPFLFSYLGISRSYFYSKVRPTWKKGIRFLWGPRGRFDYGFALALDSQVSTLPRPNGFYCDDEFSCCDVVTALMRHDKAFPRLQNGCPDIQKWHAFHLDNEPLVSTLEEFARGIGVEIIDGKVVDAVKAPHGISSVQLEDGRTLEADFFIDSSGFRSELLGGALDEPFVDYSASLFTDRALVGAWSRGKDEPILPYTTAETMNCGWAWQIEHEKSLSRGYVYSSQAISDDEAEAEFRAKNPKLGNTRIIKFRSGRYQRSWVGNVVGVGNASGFVEPLESTALMIVCQEAQNLTNFLIHTGLEPTPTIRTMYNNYFADTWDEIRDFLSLHYKFNTMLDTPFWKTCRNEVDIAGAAPVLEFFQENGPIGFARHLLRGHAANFGLEGFLQMFIGNQVPYQKRHTPTEAEWRVWQQHRSNNIAIAKNGMTSEEALAYVHHPNWKWDGDAATTTH
ncbi:tryptophan 7-halogenase [Haloferula rosea]|uniref:Tryptophan 7-halogenase n=1 Tax=Haloferula rosea TaxID=490093 RepID=A0A934RB59_9BACT|nr:tryptophan 7-halogenase [Haloferula rosea]MBK1827408.1 tryptophan 7-halogenase [Haloferula rosea]